MLRSTLAMLGIIIGVVAIGAMGVLGNSITQEISSSLSSVGDSVIVTPYSGGGGGMGPSGGGGGSSSANLMLTDQNFQLDQTGSCPERGDSCSFNIRTYASGCRKQRYRGDHLRHPDR